MTGGPWGAAGWEGVALLVTADDTRPSSCCSDCESDEQGDGEGCTRRYLFSPASPGDVGPLPLFTSSPLPFLDLGGPSLFLIRLDPFKGGEAGGYQASPKDPGPASAACCDRGAWAQVPMLGECPVGCPPKGGRLGFRQVAGPGRGWETAGAGGWGRPAPQPCSMAPSSREQDAEQPAVRGVVLQRLTDPSLGVTGPLGILRFPGQM